MQARALGMLVVRSWVLDVPQVQGRLVGFQWFFGDGRTGNGRRVSHTFRLPGSYRVLLRAVDSWDNWTFAGRTVEIRPS